MKRSLGIVLVGLVLVSGRAYGQDDLLLDPIEGVRHAARICLAEGVSWLKQKAVTDPDGWIIGPERFAKVIGYTNVTCHYSKRMMWQPVYSYTNVVTFVQDTVGAPLRKVVQARPVRQIGSNAVEQLVGDINGSIAQEQQVPIYDHTGNVRWSACGIGDAALAAYALRKAGVPDSDPVLQGVLINLRNHIITFGLPDQTWNLAWLTAVFASTPGEQAAALTQRTASRLLDGQITDEPARGLWGTLCVNPSLMAAMLRDYLAMLADLQKKELRLKEKPSKPMQAAADELRETMDRYKSLIESEVCQRAFRFVNVETSWVVDPHADPQVLLPGADHLFYNQTVTDMESTWAALFALSVASENGRLPAESWRPRPAHKLGTGATPLPPPERAQAVLARAANALVAQQAKDGRWSECNQHQPVTRFDAFKATLPVPNDTKSFPPLASPVTTLSTVQGMSALDSIGTAVGIKKLMNGFRTPYLAGATAVQKEIGLRLATVWPTPTRPPRFSREDYDLLLALSHPLGGATDAGMANLDNNNLVRALVLASSPTGSWGKGLYTWTVSSSARARYEVFKEVKIVEMNKAHILAVNATPYLYLPMTRNAEGVCTAEAVLFLASYVENPAATLEELCLNPQLEDLRKEAVRRLMVKESPIPVPAPTPATAPPPGTTGTVSRLPPAPAVRVESDVPALPAPAVDTRPKADETF